MSNLNLNSAPNSPKKLSNLSKLLPPENDLFLVGICFIGSIYLAVREPFIVTLMLLSTCILYSVNQLFTMMPALKNYRLRFWQIGSILLSLLIMLSIVQPAHALFLEGLENFVIELVTQAQSTVPEEAITLIFNLIRAIFLIFIVIVALFALNQAQQGNDWRPIASIAGMALGTILVIDAITFLFVGDGTA